MSDTPETDAHSPASYAIIRPDGVRTDYVPADFARKLERERDEARDTVLCLREQRAIARNFGEQMERERDEARVQFRSVEALGMALVKTIEELKTEKSELFVQLVNLKAGSRRSTLDEIAESVREKYEPQHEGEGIEN